MYKREEQIEAKKVNLNEQLFSTNGKLYPVSFDIPEEIDGVLTITVWDKN